MAHDLSDTISALIITIQMSGTLVGCAAAGFIGDRFGRKMAFDVSIFSVILLGVVTAAAPNWWAMSIIRFVLGVFIGNHCYLNELHFTHNHSQVRQ
jgi:MFS family permease